MNNILISDPFLFRPSGEEPSVLQDNNSLYYDNNNCYYYPQHHQHNYYSDYYETYPEDFFAFTKSQFEIDWTRQQTTDSTTTKNLFPSTHDHNYSSSSATTTTSLDPFLNEEFDFQDLDFDMEHVENDLFNHLCKYNMENDDYQSVEPSLRLDSSELMSSDPCISDDVVETNDLLSYFSEETDFFSPEGKKQNGYGINIDDQFSPSPSTAAPTPFSEDSYANIIAEVDNNTSNDSMNMVTSSLCVPMSQIHGTRLNNMGNLSTPLVQETTRRNARKASLTPRQISSPSPTLPYQFDNEGDDVSNGSSILEDVKPNIDLLEITSWTPGKASKRPATKVSSTKDHKANKTGGKSGQNSSKKQKMYEIDDPRARNAKLAFQNREKKKLEREHLIKENDLLSKKIKHQTDESEKLAKKVKALEIQLEAAQRKNRAEGGLQRVFSSAKEILETIMPPLITKYGQFNCKAAPWFKNVAIPLDDSLCDAILAKCSSPTSTYITFNISTAERMVHIDYNPEIPDFAKKTAIGQNNSNTAG